MVNERNAGNEDKPAAGAARRKGTRGGNTQAREPAKSAAVSEPPRTPSPAKGSEVAWEALVSEAPWSKKAAMAKRAAPVHPGTPPPRRVTRSADELGSNPWRNHRGSGSGHGAANQNEGKQGFRTVTSSAVWPHLAPTVPASGGTEGRVKDAPTSTAAQAKSQTSVAEKQKPEIRSDEAVAGPAPVSPAQPKAARQVPDAGETPAPRETAQVPGKTPRLSKRKPARRRGTDKAAPTAAKTCVAQKGPPEKETPPGAAPQVEASAGAPEKATPAAGKPERKTQPRSKARPVETPSPAPAKAIPEAPRAAATAKPVPTPKVRVAQKGPAAMETPRGAAPQVEASAGASQKAAPAEGKPKRRPQRRPKPRPVETPSPEPAKVIPEAPRDAAAAQPAPTPGAKAADAVRGPGTWRTQAAEAGRASRVLTSGREGQPTRSVPAPNMQFRPMPVEGLGNGILDNPWRNHQGSGPGRGGAIQSVAKLGPRTLASSVVWPHLASMPRAPASGGTEAHRQDAPRPAVAAPGVRPGAGRAAAQATSPTPLAERRKPAIRADQAVARPASVLPAQPEVRSTEAVARPAAVSSAEPEPLAPPQAQDEGETPAPVNTANMPSETPKSAKRKFAQHLVTDPATAVSTAAKARVAQQAQAPQETQPGATPQVEASAAASEKATSSPEPARVIPTAQHDAAAAKLSPTPQAVDPGPASRAPASGREGQPRRSVATPDMPVRQIPVEGLDIVDTPLRERSGLGARPGAANQTEAKLGSRSLPSSGVRPHPAPTPTPPASGETQARVQDAPGPVVAQAPALPGAGRAAVHAKSHTPVTEKRTPEARPDEEVAEPAPVSPARLEACADEEVAGPAPVSPVLQPEARADEPVAGPAPVIPAQPEPKPPCQAQNAGETPTPVETAKVPGKTPEPSKREPARPLEKDTVAPTAAKVCVAQKGQAAKETPRGVVPQVEVSAGASEKAAPSTEPAKANPVASRGAATAKPAPIPEAKAADAARGQGTREAGTADAGYASRAPASGREGQSTQAVATPDMRFKQIPVEGLGNGIVNTLGDGLGYAIDTAMSATRGVASGVSWGISAPGRLASKLKRHGAKADKD